MTSQQLGMENCGNLLLLCNTSGAESEAMRDKCQQPTEGTGSVKIKIEVEDSNSNSAAMNIPKLESSHQHVSTGCENEQAKERPAEGNCNNNRLSVEGSHTGVIMMNPCATKHPVMSDGNAEQNGNMIYFTNGNDDSIDEISTQNSDKTLDPSTTGSSFEASNPETCNSSYKESSLTQNSSLQTSGLDHSIRTSKPSQPGAKSTSGVSEFITSLSFDSTHIAFENNVNHALNTRNQKMVPEMESLSQPTLYHNAQSHDMFPQLQNRCSQQSVPDTLFVPVDNNCAYDSVPGIDAFGQPVMSQQMSAMQHHTLDQARLGMSESLGKSAHSTWSQPGTDTSFGCPLASSTPDVGGRQVSMPNRGQRNFFQVGVPAYQNLQEPRSFYGQERSRHLAPEHIQWMANNVPSVPPPGLMYNQDQVLDRNWNATPEGESMIPADSQRAQVPQTHMYVPPQQSAPLDMSPKINQPGVNGNISQRRMLSNSECMRETTRAAKRKQSTSSEDIINNPYQHADKSAKLAPSSCNKAAEKYQISTNVHTLKPRHMISWYIDHLIQENENITQISKSYTIPVNIFQSKDMYFMEALLKKINFPTHRFLNWMHSNFPNININAVDFAEGRQPSTFFSHQEEMLPGRHRNDIIKETFFYFQQRRIN
ncbi:uncharacterized protein LOC124117752 [Haliotis rufescens]|uniref:uncharacterized protein LOC124117752 n=1 Tax=Haliotis rufescens TaxID=6454 RepID=UPI00201F8A07|nr:uncharacterized protein LOC124117752 [Haliotis rufescens]